MKNEKGATTLEAALTLMPFFLFLLGIIQVCIICFGAFSVQYATNMALRESSIVKESPVKGQSRFDYVKSLVVSDLQTFHLNDATVNLCNGIVDNCDQQVAGNSGSFVTLRVNVPVYSIFGPKLSVTGTAIIKNEAY